MEYDSFARLSVSFPANSSFLTAWPEAWSDDPAFASAVGEQPVVLGIKGDRGRLPPCECHGSNDSVSATRQGGLTHPTSTVRRQIDAEIV
jgi:hypothetical protein